MQEIILTSEQIKQWDAYTVQQQGISSLALMQKAASACFNWLEMNNYLDRSFSIFCAKGNNGGDGLALATLLAGNGCEVAVHVLEFGRQGTADFQANLMALNQLQVEITFIQNMENIHPIPENDIIIDAIFGTGLNRPLTGISETLIKHLNNAPNEIISIDLPSGMFAEKSTSGYECICANYTLSFQAYKPSFLMPENADFLGEIHILDIGLDTTFLKDTILPFQFSNASLIRDIYKPRKKFTNKGTYGHAALLVGSEGMMGAAVLTAKGCLRSGVGKLTCFIPGIGYSIMQTAVPEAMVKVSTESSYVMPIEVGNKFQSIGVGPGIGSYKMHPKLLRQLFSYGHPIVIDADALNALADAGTELLKSIPPLSILTPHPKEFDRLFGDCTNDFERLNKAREQAIAFHVIIILKGYFTAIVMPGGLVYFNTSGNPGMATAGSGDVLTGIITGLLAQTYSPQAAALMGVYLHGRAGDLSVIALSEEALIASDIIDFLPLAFKELQIS